MSDSLLHCSRVFKLFTRRWHEAVRNNDQMFERAQRVFTLGQAFEVLQTCASQVKLARVDEQYTFDLFKAKWGC